ncbi:hypothetical protein O181_118417, partial [Austropuccinia psidii MF-1]|nr:hypothetical protein [Austropuccinia psidii MF-1]
MLTFVDEMTSTPPPGHLSPLPCLLSCLNWLLNPCLMIPTLSMLMLPRRSPDETPTLPPHLRPHHSLCFHTPGLTISMLVECPHPYAHVVPSRHASDTACHPYTRGVPPRHSSDTAYHPYARI